MLRTHEPLDKAQPRIPFYRRKRQYLCLCCLCLLVVSALAYFYISISKPAHQVAQDLHFSTEIDLLDLSLYLHGPPTQSFRDNLRTESKYITSWISAGWTNDVMTYINLIYLALITDRIPIIPMFVPSHIGGDKPNVDFSEVFDVQQLARDVGIPVLEWHQVKNRTSEVLDDLGCWNTWEAVQEHEHFARRSPVTSHLKFDISYTKAPSWIKVIPHFEHDRHAYFWALASLAFPESRQANLITPSESPFHRLMLPPDEHLLCFDYLYYVCAHQPFEFEFDYSPAWRYVGQHMRWTTRLRAIGDSYVRAAFQTPDESTTPPYISIHIRHGDFKNWCGQNPIKDCFASVPTIARRVEEVKAELRESRNLNVDHVILTSDEGDEDWWKEVMDQGWFRIDHSKTVERYGAWYPVLIDAVIQSGGIGFVGTDRSTMSNLARRRVQSWHNGVVRTIKWGHLGADDH
ncbi:hypothetical protein AGABI1DRAFT_67300 [Agaricus bisporus var. burnettii JB137-S8]|uniref:GDP-fucose protein O-fucosyltransferase 2 n=1 Tax=Agaricus bisporus var. burnettii (strain JB137-S8 / ATCC MYA-4627 / FGSC 10392) TaxID=597362 RepID=K5X883_AGABU|nr:uncharacterized protein AGABI1DRAFT_67300 [Agaricus bisporus var. burnettii JB137-S8]EKM84096.1 hypothetical protein AGABI1DRAFT_67300 [Agaricus bisporus var. burnettii JB137-S8]